MTFSQGIRGVDGKTRHYSTTCLLSNRSHFVLKREGKQRSNDKVQATEPFSLLQAPWTVTESSLSLQGFVFVFVFPFNFFFLFIYFY